MADNSVAAVHTLGRRKLALEHPKLTQHVVDFKALPPLPAVTEVFLALGTTIKVAGSPEAFRAVDHDANLAVARTAGSRGATRLGLVSAMGADPRSRIFYNRVKGELEHALAQLHCPGLVIARPSFLVGDRESLGQPRRPGETLALELSRWLGWLIPDNYKAIEASQVAAMLLRTVPVAQGMLIVSSGAMRRGAIAATAS